ncbi:metal ABC transporter substrate-binding protein [Jannaschia sp. W003]|uniref:metal ABC transporter substrate-binding protein n=1 Tax=Jannaschia sp. W003 TaxID=2867012 RepID=UPI0021A83E64|nr:metal ABC transporter substrate-binding protein [Jannaschia sp. W003]UWQ20610.1 metal ABC transporter substrate-binding protein [Jannaschia sp. W003]
MRLAVILAAALGLATPAAAADFKVATTFTVIADMARNVAGDAAEVVSITRPGAEVHGYQPTPRDILGVRDADLVLWNGLNLELWFEQFFRNLRDVPQAVISEGIEPLAITGGTYDGLPNPHAWMGLDNALVYVDNIAAALAEHDPDNAEAYRANAETYKAEIAATIGPLRDAIRALPEEDRWLVTSEGAFSYLARDYGLRELFLWPINSDVQGTPQQVRAVIDAVRSNDIKAVFSESTISPDAAMQVARETEAEYAGVLYVDSLSEADGPVPTYLDLLRVTSETILAGLSR